MPKGNAFYLMLGLLGSGREFKNRSDLARHVIGNHGRPVSRQRISVLIQQAVAEGYLDKDPFEPRPQMRRYPRGEQTEFRP